MSRFIRDLSTSDQGEREAAARATLPAGASQGFVLAVAAAAWAGLPAPDEAFKGVRR
jgi:hypothetical protein